MKGRKADPHLDKRGGSGRNLNITDKHRSMHKKMAPLGYSRAVEG